MNLLPCPFCGGLDLEVMEQILETDGVLGYGLTVYCNCGVQGAVAETDAEAIALWNKRFSPGTRTSDKLPFTCFPLELAVKRIIERLEYLAENGSFTPTDGWILRYLRMTLELFEKLQA